MKKAVLRSAVIVVVALTLGVLTAFAQGWLPEQLGSLANSAGTWALAAFILALLVSTTAQEAVAFGSLSLLGLLAGYVVGAQTRDVPSSTTTVAFWIAAALIAGPLLGLSAYWIKSRRDLLAAIGVGLVSGVLIGEGIYGLTQIADTTYPPYWWGEIVVGLILLVVGARRLLGVRAVTLAIGVAAFAAAAFVLVYSQTPFLIATVD